VGCRVWTAGRQGGGGELVEHAPSLLYQAQRELLIDNLLVRIHFIIVMIRWTGLAPWEFEFPFPGSLTAGGQEGGGELVAQAPAPSPPLITPVGYSRRFRVWGELTS